MKKVFTWVTGINLIAAIIILNVGLSFYPYLRIDLSKDKIHSLSEITRKTIREMDDVVKVKVYLTADLPAEIKPVAADLKTVLEEFSRINRKRFLVEYFDPSKDEAIKKEAEGLGVTPLQFSSIKSDKFEVQSGYFGLVMTYGNKQEVLPVAGDVGNLEYFLISGVKKLTRDKTPTVVVAEESGAETEILWLKKFLEKDYRVAESKLDEGVKLDEEAESLVVVDRKTKLPEKAKTEVGAWVDKGKGLIIFGGGAEVGQTMSAKKKTEIGWEELLKKKGIEVEPKLIVDASSTIANFRTPNGTFLTQYPYWIQVRPENINSEIPAMSGISSLVLPWASPIKINGLAKKLFSSSEKSLEDMEMGDISPTAKKNFGESKGEKYTLGAINTDEGKVAIIGSGEMIKDQFVQNNQQNLMLALNLVDYFSQDASLLAIRGKSLRNSPLAMVDDRVKELIKGVNVALPGVLLLAGAGAGGVIRKRKKNWNEG